MNDSPRQINRSDSMNDILERADWEEIEYNLQNMESGIIGNSPRTRRLRTKLGIVRMLFCHKINRINGSNTIDGSFFIGIFKTLRQVENEFDAMEIKKREFLIFLKLLFHKLEKLKLKVRKPLAGVSEFKKMKGVIENVPLQ